MNERIHTPKETVRPNQEQSETLNQSLTQRVKEALEKIRSRVKAYVEKGKVKQNLTEGRYEEIYEMIEEYPEDIRAKIRERVDQELMSKPYILVSRFPDKALAERDKFLYSTDEKGERKLKIEGQIVVDIFHKVLKEKNISLLIKNLDIFYDLKNSEQSKSEDLKYLVNALEIEIRDLILSSDENVIQEALKTASPEIRKLYEDKFEKVYLKKEYIDKAIAGAREKGEKAETEEEKEKYRRVVEGLEYLRDYEKNVREHCAKMFEKYGIFDPETTENIVQNINKQLIMLISKRLILERARNLNLEIIEFVSLLQFELNSFFKNREEDIISNQGNEAIRDALTNGDILPIEALETHASKPYSTKLADSNRYETRRVYEKIMFGSNFIENYSKIDVRNLPKYAVFINEGKDKLELPAMRYPGTISTIKLNKLVRERCTVTIGSGGESMQVDDKINPTVPVLLELPHISLIIADLIKMEPNANISEDIKKICLGLNNEGKNIKRPTEIQIHGRVTGEDITAILVTEEPVSSFLEELKIFNAARELPIAFHTKEGDFRKRN